MATSARLDELKKKFDESPRRYFAPLANEYRKLGDLTQAVAICRAHLPNQPAHISGHIVLAQALYEARELGESRQVFESALDLDPENLIALRYLGDIASEQGEVGMARSWYERVLDADPRNEEIAQLLAALDASNVAVDVAPSYPAAEDSDFFTRPTPLPVAAVDDMDHNDSGNGHGVYVAEGDGMSDFAHEDEASSVVGGVADAAQAPALDAPGATYEAFAVPAGQPAVSESGDAVDEFALSFDDDLAADSPSTPSSQSLGAEPAAATDPDDWFASPSHATAADDSADEFDGGFFPDLASVTPASVPVAPPVSEALLQEAEVSPFAPTPSPDVPLVAPAGDVSMMAADEVVAAETPEEAASEIDFATRDASDEATDHAGSEYAGLADDSSMSPSAPVAVSNEATNWSSDAPEPPAYAAPDAEGDGEDTLGGWSTLAYAAPQPSAELYALDDAVGEPASDDSLGEEVPPLAGLVSMGTGLPPVDVDHAASWIAPPAQSGEWKSVEEHDGAPDASYAEARHDELPPSVFVTETMAELYVQQGFVAEALAIYRQLLARSPNDAMLVQRIAALEQPSPTESTPDATRPSPDRLGRSARAFFGAFARRSPGRAAAGGDEAREGEDGAAPARDFTGVATPDEAMTVPDAPVTSLGTMFEQASVPAHDESAALSLASAFESPVSSVTSPVSTATTSAVSSAPANVPAKAQELSLEHLFRDVPARSPGAVTLDEFFADAPESSRAGEPPASPAGGDSHADIQQFTAWLEGLKKK